MAKTITMDLINKVIVPRLSAELMKEFINNEHLVITRQKLIETTVLESNGETSCLLDIVLASMSDGYTDETEYFKAVYESNSSYVENAYPGKEYLVQYLPFIRMVVTERKKKLFKPEIFEAKLIRTQMLNDICECIKKLAQKAGLNMYFGYIAGTQSNGEYACTTMSEDHVFSKDEILFLEKCSSPYSRAIGGFIMSTKEPIKDNGIIVF